jgi:hypothetical protein
VMLCRKKVGVTQRCQVFGRPQRAYLGFKLFVVTIDSGCDLLDWQRYFQL